MTAIPFKSPEDRDAFLSGRTDDIGIDPLEDLAHAIGLTVSQLLGDARSKSIPTIPASDP
jgi:hypothetical protein